MKTLKSVIAIILISATTVFAGTEGKVVKATYVNGELTPTITLNAVEISAVKKEVKTTTAIAASSYAPANAILVKANMINGELIPLVELNVAEVIADRVPKKTYNRLMDSMMNLIVSIIAKLAVI